MVALVHTVLSVAAGQISATGCPFADVVVPALAVSVSLVVRRPMDPQAVCLVAALVALQSREDLSVVAAPAVVAVALEVARRAIDEGQDHLVARVERLVTQ